MQIVSPEPSMLAKRVKIKEHVKVKTSSQTRYLKKKKHYAFSIVPKYHVMALI